MHQCVKMDRYNLVSEIISLLERRHHSLSAKKISNSLEASKTEVNSVLYEELSNTLIRDKNYKWSFNENFSIAFFLKIKEEIIEKQNDLQESINEKNIIRKKDLEIDIDILKVKRRRSLLKIPKETETIRIKELEEERNRRQVMLVSKIMPEEANAKEEKGKTTKEEIKEIISSTNLSIPQKIKNLLLCNVDDLEICTMLDIPITQVDREATFLSQEQQSASPVFSQNLERQESLKTLHDHDQELKEKTFSHYWKEANGPLLEMYPDLHLSEIFNYVSENTIESGIKLKRGNSEVIKWYKDTQWSKHPVKLVELKNRYIMNSVPYKELRDHGIPKTKEKQIADHLLENPNLNDAMEKFDVKEQRIKQVASKFKIELVEINDIISELAESHVRANLRSYIDN